ncbi:MAG: glutaredoxin [Deltaproteobacteria bacterium]|nr:glutaredoxin [Deltaproteobacteria bacterium]
MSLLDRLGKKTFDAIDRAARAAETLRNRVEPMLEGTALGERLRERDRLHDVSDVPTPPSNVSPFVPQPTGDATRPPLGKPELAAQLFGRGTDPWTARTRQLLRDRGIELEWNDLEAEGGVQLEAQVVTETKHPSGPWVYLRGEFVGGFNAVHELDRLGQLEVMTLPPEERRDGRGRTRIVVAKRGGDEQAEGERGNPDDRK